MNTYSAMLWIHYTHLASASLAILTTAAMAFLGWNLIPRGQSRLIGLSKAVYLFMRISTGVAGLSGLWLTIAGSWQVMWFPWLGLLAFLLHGFAASAGKRALAHRQSRRLHGLLLLQNGLLLAAAVLMAVKPF